MAALTGDAAVTRNYANTQLLTQIAQCLKTKPEEVIERIAKMQADIKDLHRKNKEAMAASLPSFEELKAKAQTKGNVQLLALEIQGADADALRRYGDGIKRQSEPFAGFFLAQGEKGKVPLVVAISKPLVDRGWHARDLLRPVCTTGSRSIPSREAAGRAPGRYNPLGHR